MTFGHLNGATARIFRNRAKARIRVSDRIVTVGRRRFSIMHEIGHYLLNHALPTEGDEASWFATCRAQRNRSEEREADVFAVEHLTPARMVRPYCDITPVDLHAVRTLANVFTTSPVMSAMRFVELVERAVRRRILGRRPRQVGEAEPHVLGVHRAGNAAFSRDRGRGLLRSRRDQRRRAVSARGHLARI